MWNRINRAGIASISLALITAACSKESGTSAGIVGNDAKAAVVTQYTQTEELGNPLVQEVTIVKANHAAYDKTQPYNTATFRPQTEAFIVNVGGRPAAYATTVAGVLYPDILGVDTSRDPATVGWLTQTLGTTYTNPSNPGWGGRKLSDDVVDIGLTAIFSSLLSPTGASCAPFMLPLCTDNVNGNDVANLATFPYVAPPST